MRALPLATLLLAAPLIAGFGGPDPFQVAPFLSYGDDFAPGAWRSSTEVSSDESIEVAVMATWCGHCKRLLEQLATSREARDRIDMVLYFDTEYEDAMKRAGHAPETIDPARRLAYPERLRGVSLPLYFAKKAEFDGLVSGYPTLLSCTREGCRRMSRGELGLH